MYLLILSLLSVLLSNGFGLPSGSTYGRDRFNTNPKCIDSEETGRELYVGESFTRSGRCIRVQCLGSLQLWEDRCQVPRLEGNCSRVPAANEFLDYPRCCSTYECTIFKNDEHSVIMESRSYDHYGRLLREHITQRVRILVKHPLHLTMNNQTDDWNRDYNRYTTPATNSARRDNVFEIKYN